MRNKIKSCLYALWLQGSDMIWSQYAQLVLQKVHQKYPTPPGLCLLEFGEMMAADMAKRRGIKKKSLWIDARTARTLKDICGSVITICFAGAAPIFWQRLTERRLEQRFGRIRTSFGNCQLSISDYWRASLRLMKKDLGKELPEQVPRHDLVSEQDFTTIASTAFHAARKLAAMCSDHTESELNSLASMHWATGGADEDEDADLGKGDGPLEPVEDMAAAVFQRIRASAAFVEATEGETEDPEVEAGGLPLCFSIDLWSWGLGWCFQSLDFGLCSSNVRQIMVDPPMPDEISHINSIAIAWLKGHSLFTIPSLVHWHCGIAEFAFRKPWAVTSTCNPPQRV